MTQELRKLAQRLSPDRATVLRIDAEQAGEAILSLLDRLEKAEKDAARLDWLEASTEMHGFCHIGYGDFHYYAHQQDGCKTVRQVIDEAMEASK